VERRRTPVQLGLALAPAFTCCLSPALRHTRIMTAGTQWASELSWSAAGAPLQTATSRTKLQLLFASTPLWRNVLINAERAATSFPDKFSQPPHSFKEPHTDITTTLPHLSVTVSQPARRPVKGEQRSAAKRRTLDGAHQSAGYPRARTETDQRSSAHPRARRLASPPKSVRYRPYNLRELPLQNPCTHHGHDPCPAAAEN
jgi:hypothetical protein